MLVDTSDYDIPEAKDNFEIFLRKNSNEAFLNVLISFIKEHKNEPSLDDIKGFINANKENLSKIEDGIENLLIGFTKICVLNNFQDIKRFLELARAFQIKNLTDLRQGIIERVEDETRGNNKDSRKIIDFFQTPKDLLSFYVETYPRLFDNGNELVSSIIRIANEHRIAKTTSQKVYNGCFNLFDLFQRYDNEQIAAFIKSKPVSEDVIYLSTNVLIWASFFDNDIEASKVKEIFPTIRNLIDFYIYKVPDQLKQKKDFSIFCFLKWLAYTDRGAATGEWDDYLKEISKDENHISLFFNFFEGKMSFEKQDINDIVSWRYVFSGFQSIQGFLDFYLKIYSTHLDCLKSENNKRDYILGHIIFRYSWDISNFLSTNGNEERYKYFVPFLINSVCEYRDIKMSDFSNIVKFLDKNVNLDQDLKNKLLKKIDDDIVEKMKPVAVSYANKTYEYPPKFETNLSYIQEIMKSKDVLPETKKKIYEWAKNAVEEDQKQWEYVLEMCTCNIESKEKNDPKFDEKDDKYKYLSEYRPQDYKNLKTLKSHQGDWYLKDLENSPHFRELNIRINNLDSQIDTLQNRLDKTEFKLGWILIVWFSGIGTIILLGLRYYWNSSRNNLGTTRNTLSTEKQNPENKIKADCEKKKTDYEDSLKKAKEAMKKWGKSKNNKDYPYDNHKKYCQLLKQIIDIYEKDHNLSKNQDGNESPLQEEQNDTNKQEFNTDRTN